MSQTQRRSAIAATAIVVPVMIVALPPLLVWVFALWLLVRHWRQGPGARLSMLDSPGRLLAAAVATLPEHRREWGAAMTAELAEVHGRAARWGFALSCARSALWLPRSGPWPMLALVTGVVAAAVTAAGQGLGAAVPGLGVLRRASSGSSVPWWCWPSRAPTGCACRCPVRPSW